MEQLLNDLQNVLDQLKASAQVQPSKDAVRQAVEDVLVNEGWAKPAVNVPVVAEPSEVETPDEAGSAEDTNEVTGV